MKNPRVELIEKSLKVTLPKDFAEFIAKHGDYEGDGLEIYGYDESYLNIDEIPCVIGATKLYKMNYPLSNSDIVISHTGYEDYIVVLDTDTGNIFEINSDGNKTKKAPSFKNWFDRIVADEG